MQHNILIIDDDIVSQFATRYCIQQYGKDVSIATALNAEEGLIMLSNLIIEDKELPNIIFLDLVMDEMNGWEFLDKLQELSKGKQKPEVYILSSFSNTEDKAIAKENPLIEGHIVKPLSRNSLNNIFATKINGDTSV